jgi:endonuclease YncB( thermonuclease family)
LRKGQVRWVSGTDVRRQNQFIDRVVGLFACDPATTLAAPAHIGRLKVSTLSLKLLMLPRFQHRLTRMAFFLALSGTVVALVSEFSGTGDHHLGRRHNTGFARGVSKRIRLFGIDCPELEQPFRAKKKELTGDLAFGSTMKVLVGDIDCYHRLVTEITLPDGRMLNHEIVRAGLAWWCRPYARSDKDWSVWSLKRRRRSVDFGLTKIRCLRGNCKKWRK